MKLQISLLSITILLSFITFSQSKKEQIKQLNISLDSLNQVLESERTINAEKIERLNSTVIKLESEISNLNSSLKSLNFEYENQKELLELTNLELIVKRDSIVEIRKELKLKNDSIDLITIELSKLKPPLKISPTNSNSNQVSKSLGYKSVTIGTQTWMTENLNVSTFRNGDLILEAKTKEEWKKAGENKQAVWCYYNFDSKNEAKYGKLYNYYAVNDPRGLAPEGWHIPKNSEWYLLTDYLGGENKAGLKLKKASGWNTWSSGGSKTCINCINWNLEYRNKVPCNKCHDTRIVPAPYITNSGNGTNTNNFSALPSGSVDFNGEILKKAGDFCLWWSADINNNSSHANLRKNINAQFSHILGAQTVSDYVYYRSIQNFSESVQNDDIQAECGLSVRCIKD
jgi:uncharacterized protein (TIGR02145 family)